VDPMCVSDPRDVSLGVVAYQKKRKAHLKHAHSLNHVCS
jgi:hypothetical protein